jgi:hypothetical protein
MYTPANLVYYRGDLRSCWSPPTGNAGDPRKPGFRAMNPNRKYRAMSAFLTVILAIASAASAEWKEKMLYSFQGPDGAGPIGGVVFDKQGNLYGATQDGGSDSCRSANQCGTVFKLAPPAKQGDPWTETVLYVFKGNASNDGATPFGGLVIDSFGNLYGTTGYGGTGDCTLLGSKLGCGTVFELSPPAREGGAWTETILYSFPTAKQGYLPNGDLVFDGAGNLYGATMFGGGKGTTCDPFYGGQCGVAFELSPPKEKGGAWTEKVLHNFAGIGNGQQTGDGANPNGGLVLDGNGSLYGTTYIGGYNCPHNSNQGCGTVFKLRLPSREGAAWTESILHQFKDAPDGGGPSAGAAFGKKGELYGTTVGGGGGNYPSGTAFELIPDTNGSWTERVLHSFQDSNDGSEPRAAVVIGTNGELYSTASGGGAYFAGTLFRLKGNPAGGWTFAVLYSFNGANNGDGAYPAGNIVLSAGNIFGTTEVGGTGTGCGYGGCGTVFRVWP